MKTRPIIFTSPMVRALLDGSKTQTRRAAKLTDAAHVKEVRGHRRWHPADPEARLASPYGQPGDQLWVRETTLKVEEHGYEGPVYAESEMGRAALYGGLGPEDDYADVEAHEIKKRPAIFMPKSMARITLEILSVRLERLQDISETNAIAEGCVTEEITSGFDGKKIKVPAEVSCGKGVTECWDSAKDWYADLWESINGTGSWYLNPWVWVIEFKKVAA